MVFNDARENRPRNWLPGSMGSGTLDRVWPAIRPGALQLKRCAVIAGHGVADPLQPTLRSLFSACRWRLPTGCWFCRNSRCHLRRSSPDYAPAASNGGPTKPGPEKLSLEWWSVAWFLPDQWSLVGHETKAPLTW